MKTTSVILIITMCVLSGCGKPSLSRNDAQRRILAYPQARNLAHVIPVVPGEFRKGFGQGLWTQQGLTEKGRRDFVAASETELTLCNPADVTIEVTGIAGVPMTQDIKEVQFAWAYRDISSVAKRFAVRGGVGTADFRLYDDGWRLDTAQFSTSPEPMTLTRAEQQAEIQDAEEEQERLRLAAEVEQRKRAQLEALQQQSRQSTRILLDEEFIYQNPVKRYDQHVVISDVDIAFINEMRDERNRRIWFGDIGAFEAGTYEGQSFINIGGRDAIYFNSADQRDRVLKIAQTALADWSSKFRQAFQQE